MKIATARMPVSCGVRAGFDKFDGQYVAVQPQATSHITEGCMNCGCLCGPLKYVSTYGVHVVLHFHGLVTESMATPDVFQIPMKYCLERQCVKAC